MSEAAETSGNINALIGFGLLGTTLYSFQLWWSFSSFASAGDGVGIAVAIILNVPSLVAVIDLVGKKFERKLHKFLWLIAVTIGGFMGAAVYFGYNYGRKS